MYDENTYDYEYQPRPRRNTMATAAVVFGILSLVTSLMIYISLPCGALAVIFALLSRTEKPMRKKAKTGLICGICGMAATVIITVSAFYYVLSDSGMRSFLEYYCQMYTGDYNFDLDEMLEEMFPFIGNLDTPAFQDSGSDIPSTDEPSIIEPKGEGTFL